MSAKNLSIEEEHLLQIEAALTLLPPDVMTTEIRSLDWHDEWPRRTVIWNRIHVSNLNDLRRRIEKLRLARGFGNAKLNSLRRELRRFALSSLSDADVKSCTEHLRASLEPLLSNRPLASIQWPFEGTTNHSFNQSKGIHCIADLHEYARKVIENREEVDTAIKETVFWMLCYTILLEKREVIAQREFRVLQRCGEGTGSLMPSLVAESGAGSLTIISSIRVSDKTVKRLVTELRRSQQTRLNKSCLHRLFRDMRRCLPTTVIDRPLRPYVTANAHTLESIASLTLIQDPTFRDIFESQSFVGTCGDFSKQDFASLIEEGVSNIAERGSVQSKTASGACARSEQHLSSPSEYLTRIERRLSKGALIKSHDAFRELMICLLHSIPRPFWEKKLADISWKRTRLYINKWEFLWTDVNNSLESLPSLSHGFAALRGIGQIKFRNFILDIVDNASAEIPEFGEAIRGASLLKDNPPISEFNDVSDLFTDLSPGEMLICRRRLLRGGGESAASLEEVAASTGLTRERVRQIQSKLVAKLALHPIMKRAAAQMREVLVSYPGRTYLSRFRQVEGFPLSDVFEEWRFYGELLSEHHDIYLVRCRQYPELVEVTLVPEELELKWLATARDTLESWLDGGIRISQEQVDDDLRAALVSEGADWRRLEVLTEELKDELVFIENVPGTNSGVVLGFRENVAPGRVPRSTERIVRRCVRLFNRPVSADEMHNCLKSFTVGSTGPSFSPETVRLVCHRHLYFLEGNGGTWYTLPAVYPRYAEWSALLLPQSIDLMKRSAIVTWSGDALLRQLRMLPDLAVPNEVDAGILRMIVLDDPQSRVEMAGRSRFALKSRSKSVATFTSEVRRMLNESDSPLFASDILKSIRAERRVLCGKQVMIRFPMVRLPDGGIALFPKHFGLTEASGQRLMAVLRKSIRETEQLDFDQFERILDSAVAADDLVRSEIRQAGVDRASLGSIVRSAFRISLKVPGGSDKMRGIRSVRTSSLEAWKRRFEELREFMRLSGGDLPKVRSNRPSEQKLARWFANQRRRMELHNLPEVEEGLLRSLGDQVLVRVHGQRGRHSGSWMRSFSQLRDWLLRNPGARPNKASADTVEKRLAMWVFSQRARKKRGNLSDSQMEALDSIDFV